MALTINWSDEAITEFEQIIDFILKTEFIVELISTQPYLFPESNFKQIRKAVVTKQTSFYYLIQKQEIYYIITFWDNRKNPNSNPF